MAWGRVRLKDQFALVFTYVDPRHGPSAKGAPMRGSEPTLEDAEDAKRRPSVTIRLEKNFAPAPLKEEDLVTLGLTEPPAWAVHFPQKPKPPPVESPAPPERNLGVLIAILTLVAVAATAVLLQLIDW